MKKDHMKNRVPLPEDQAPDRAFTEQLIRNCAVDKCLEKLKFLLEGGYVSRLGTEAPTRREADMFGTGFLAGYQECLKLMLEQLTVFKEPPKVH